MVVHYNDCNEDRSEQTPARIGDQQPAVSKIMCRICINGHTPRTSDPNTMQAVDILFEENIVPRALLYAEPVSRAYRRTVCPVIHSYRSSVVRPTAGHSDGSGRTDYWPSDRASRPARVTAASPVHGARRPTVRPAQSYLPGPPGTVADADRRFASLADHCVRDQSPYRRRRRSASRTSAILLSHVLFAATRIPRETYPVVLAGRGKFINMACLPWIDGRRENLIGTWPKKRNHECKSRELIMAKIKTTNFKMSENIRSSDNNYEKTIRH
uniref:Uncharacterized protein n=1 Tax=Sipha flava TaxID=143950 RepID=A0A2S2QRS5_9HEMI